MLPLALALLEVLLVERGGQRVRPAARERRGGARAPRTSLTLEGSVGPRAPRPVGPARRPRRSDRRAGPAAPRRLAGDRRHGGRAARRGDAATACSARTRSWSSRSAPLLASARGYLGAAILGDGRVALLLDPASLCRASESKPRLAPAPARRERPLAPKILVVEDSFTVRELQRSILQAAGYRVEIASRRPRGPRPRRDRPRDRPRDHRPRDAEDERARADARDSRAAPRARRSRS